MLHVVNGDSTADAIRARGVLQPLDPLLGSTRDPDDVIAWRDVLYEGPVRAGLSPVNLAHERCQFIASRGWEPYITARQAFGHRDAAIASTKRQDEVVFWFESDLYDVLQLVQVLDRLAARRPEGTRFSWILVDQRPDAPERHGFGHLSTDQVEQLLASRQAVPDPVWMEARRVWHAFIGGDPAALQHVASDVTLSIPFLLDGLARLLAEFPERSTGLSRSEQLVLDAIATGPVTPGEVFRAVQAAEPRPFLGDRQVWDRLDWFATSAPALIDRADGLPWVSPVVDLMSLDDPDMVAFAAQTLTLTAVGQSVLAGQTDWLTIRPHSRWLGGHEITPMGSWRVDGETHQLIAAKG